MGLTVNGGSPRYCNSSRRAFLFRRKRTSEIGRGPSLCVRLGARNFFSGTQLVYSLRPSCTNLRFHSTGLFSRYLFFVCAASAQSSGGNQAAISTISAAMPAPRPTDVVGVVLAGGVNERFAPLATPAFPKALAPVAQKRAIFYPLLSLARAGIARACVIASPDSVDTIREYVVAVVRTDPLLASLTVDVVAGCGDSVGSADVLREMDLEHAGGGNAHVLVVTADLISDCALSPLVDAHFAAGASCTVLLSENCAPAANAAGVDDLDAGSKAGLKGGKGGKVAKCGKKEKGGKPGEEYDPELYAIVDGSGRRLLGLVDEVNLPVDSILRIRPAILQRFPDLTVRADLGDAHVYLFAPWILSHLLPARPSISNVRLELVPYLARRQFTLGRGASTEDWADAIPGGEGSDVKVELFVVPFGGFVRRVNIPETYLSTSLKVASGALTRHLCGDGADLLPVGSHSRDAGKKGGKKGAAGSKPAKGESPFATAGERTNVSPDSFVGPNCSAGDKASVKKSCLSNDVRLGAGVKLNGCVVLESATIEDGVNLSGCVIAANGVVGKDSILKNCRVAPEISVPEATEAEGKEFAGAGEQADTSGFMDSFEFS